MMALMSKAQDTATNTNPHHQTEQKVTNQHAFAKARSCIGSGMQRHLPFT